MIVVTMAMLVIKAVLVGVTILVQKMAMTVAITAQTCSVTMATEGASVT